MGDLSNISSIDYMYGNATTSHILNGIQLFIHAIYTGAEKNCMEKQLYVTVFWDDITYVAFSMTHWHKNAVIPVR